jgi:hypothetical protein
MGEAAGPSFVLAGPQDAEQAGVCSKRNRQLIEIDHYGQRLIGCVECNRWSWRGSNRLFMELPEEDLSALRKLRSARPVGR